MTSYLFDGEGNFKDVQGNNYASNSKRQGSLSGTVANSNVLYQFFKNTPYKNNLAYDPVSQKIQNIKSNDFSKYVMRMKNIQDKTQRQIRYNQFTNSGGFYQRSQGFDFRTDYHRSVAGYKLGSGYKAIYFVLLACVLYKFLKN